jgi:hypothetical protein
MSNPDSQTNSSPDSDFDLEKLFLPAWAKRPANENQFADYAGGGGDRETRRFDRRGGPDRRDRPPRRPGMDDGGRPRPRPQEGQRPRDGQRPFDRPRRDEGPRREGGLRRDDRPRREEKPEELPQINVAFLPDDLVVDSLARQIRMTGRAYPLFEIAVMVLEKPERHGVTLSVRKTPEATIVQPLFLCALDDSVWLTEEEAVRWALDKHFATFYQPERTQIEAPKGTYTFVAQCGMSGIILGPPNYHGYQEALRKLHAERFARMPFEMFKARVRIVRDEAVVKKWVEDQSWRAEYVCLNLPEPLKLTSREEVEKHFRETHLANIIRPVETVHLNGPASRGIRQPGLARLLRSAWEQQRRFPIQVATVLSQQFASRGLQFFKVNRTVTHVAVARPRHLDLDATPVSEGVRRIVEFINAHPKCTRRDLVPALAPRPAAPTPPPAVEGESVPAPAAPFEPTPEETQVIGDLHWLVHQGHVIEFANGALETAKRPLIKPPKAAAAPAATAPTEPDQPPTELPPIAGAPNEAGLLDGAAAVPSAAPAEDAQIQEAANPPPEDLAVPAPATVPSPDPLQQVAQPSPSPQ